MKPLKILLFSLTLLVAFLLLGSQFLTYDASIISEKNSSPYYDYHALHSRDGIGKFYLGREIAKVMGHQEFLWLERPSREQQENPQKLLEVLNIKPTDTIADIGAGSGYFSFRLASLVPDGKVFAVDIQPEMLDIIDFFKKENEVNNIETILGTIKNPNLPKNMVDIVLMVDAYHEFEYPREMMDNIVTSLPPGGKVILAEYRRENPLIPIKTLHKMTEKQVKNEMDFVGLTWEKTEEILPQQHLIFFTKI
ncbi:class I SAM-dependent methyltransferase [Cyanothece sp. BG0011]|uniref:class I SAM-dependent methyltransferase n=1 Tax=Cyanothece sp. BG0011 TaxID=2082950 RepID=UPI000D1E3A50|nr:class I SAM-dependent methyltransferase [Cyanothece sp. BG0011]